MEEEKEDQELSNKYQDRLDLPEEEWIELPPNKSAIDYYREMKGELTMIKVRLTGDLKVIKESIAELEKLFKIYAVSKPYDNRNSLDKRVYVEMELKEVKSEARRENNRDEKGRIVIYDVKDIPKNMTEDEVHEFWIKHCMSEELLEASIIEEEEEDKE